MYQIFTRRFKSIVATATINDTLNLSIYKQDARSTDFRSNKFIRKRKDFEAISSCCNLQIHQSFTYHQLDMSIEYVNDC